ncbi:MAG: CYTH domain-containing protein [Tannerellaceae bacterium]|jgi:CYTH domain-containing protein|nr:CYTH domain-containing protein [Tannerellaceae bacterium]
MAIEIERKFIVTGDFSKEVQYSRRIVQGYLCSGAGRSVRIRISGDEGFLTIKGAADESGWSRYEFERSIPLADAEEMLKLCEEGLIDKIRHYIPAGKHTWEVDVFNGDNRGLIIAEIELSSANESFEKPDWLGKEVTTDYRYYNAMLSKYPYSLWEKE